MRRAMRARLGKVGYKPFGAGPETKIKFVTEGILLRQMLQDAKLSGVAAVIFDEFHERHLYGDITLAQALELQEKQRPELILIVMSATLDAACLFVFSNRVPRSRRKVGHFCGYRIRAARRGESAAGLGIGGRSVSATRWIGRQRRCVGVHARRL